MDNDIIHEPFNTTISAMMKNFTGPLNTKDYNPAKTLKIHRRNRAYVWKLDRQMLCLDSMLQGLYIPPIICSSRIENGGEIREVMEGGNRTVTFWRILHDQVRKLTDAERMKVSMYPITQVVMKNLTKKQEREQFRRLNHSVKVTDGQLYYMSQDDSPLVKEAMAFLNDIDYPLRAQITEVFFDTVNKDNSGKTNLANALAIVSGCLNGVYHITKSYSRQEEKIDLQTPINRSRIVEVFSQILHIFEKANKECPLTNKTKKKAQWPIGKYIGPMLYDILTCKTSLSDVIKKWKGYLVAVRINERDAEDAIEIPGAKNIKPDTLKRQCFKVEVFMKEKRLATKEEINRIKHVHDDADKEESDEDIDEDENDEDDESSEEDE
jgi:hypothetical protein